MFEKPQTETAPDVQEKPLVEKLLAVRASIKHGWCKYVNYRDGKVCLSGAIQLGFPGGWDEEVATAINKEAFICLYSKEKFEENALVNNDFALDLKSDDYMVRFNDEPKTTKDDVIALVDRVIAKARAS